MNNESIKAFVAENEISMDMAEALAEIIGLEKVITLKPEFISFLVRMEEGIDKDLSHLTPSEGIEYLKALLITYVAKNHFEISKNKDN